jgi:hypothetical protein
MARPRGCNHAVLEHPPTIAWGTGQTYQPGRMSTSIWSNVGLDVGRGKEPVALVRLRLAKALIGVAEANALAAESIAIERGIGTEEIAQTEALALHAAAFNGMPDPVFHLTARAMAIVMGLAAVEPDPAASKTRPSRSSSTSACVTRSGRPCHGARHAAAIW